MKKILLPLIAGGLIFLGCEKHPGKVGNGYDTVNRTVALQMIAHYLDSNVVRVDSTIIRHTPISRENILWALADKKTIRVKLMLAAYLDSDSDPTKRNTITMLLQLKQATKSDTTYLYYDLKNEKKGVKYKMTVCPPPNQCDPESPDDASS